MLFTLRNILSGFSSLNQDGFKGLSQCFVDNDLCLRDNIQRPPYCTFKKCKTLYHNIILFYYWKQEIDFLNSKWAIRNKKKKFLFSLYLLLLWCSSFLYVDLSFWPVSFTFPLKKMRFNIFYKAGLLTINSFSFLCVWKSLYFFFT